MYNFRLLLSIFSLMYHLMLLTSTSQINKYSFFLYISIPLQTESQITIYSDHYRILLKNKTKKKKPTKLLIFA